MSGAVGGSTYGALARILTGAGTLQTQYTNLQEQTTTGLISQNYAGLPQTAQALSLSAVEARNTSYSSVIEQSQGKASAMQAVLTQINTVVTTMSSAALQQTSSGSSTISTVAAEAKAAFQQIVSLLNTNYGGDYVFSGADSGNPPIPSPDTATTSGMFTQIGAQVQALGTIPSATPVAQVISNTVAIAADTTAGTTVFSSYLTTPSPAGGLGAPAGQVQVSDTQTVSLEVSANQNAGSTSDPAINGTGSAINDILRSLAVMANSTTAAKANPDFGALMKDAAATLASAGATLSQQGAAIGVTQNTLSSAATANTSMQTVVNKQLVGLLNVDMASAITKLQAVNTQLQTSYQVLALARTLNLASLL